MWGLFLKKKKRISPSHSQFSGTIEILQVWIQETLSVFKKWYLVHSNLYPSSEINYPTHLSPSPKRVLNLAEIEQNSQHSQVESGSSRKLQSEMFPSTTSIPFLIDLLTLQHYRLLLPPKMQSKAVTKVLRINANQPPNANMEVTRRTKYTTEGSELSMLQRNIMQGFLMLPKIGRWLR